MASMRETATSSPKKGSTRVMHLFPSVEDIKDLVGRTMGAHEAQILEFEATGCCSALARNNWFNNLCLGVILMNTIWIAIDTDLDHSAVLCQAPPIFQIVENGFCSFFVFEILIRILALKVKRDFFKDSWLMFDFLLVSTMVWETWVLVLWFILSGSATDSSNGSSMFRVFRLFRLLRVARAARIVGNVPELMILAEGMVLAVRSVAAVLIFLALVIYLFSIIFTDLLRGTAAAPGQFANVPQSMNTLLLQVVCGFDLDLAGSLQDVSIPIYVTFMVYFLMASLTLQNMLVGIICDVVANVSSNEKESLFVVEVENLVNSLMMDLDTDGSHTLSKEEFDGLIMNNVMMKMLYDFGVDVIGIVDFGEFLFQECEELSFDDFLELVVQFRQSKPATMRDVMNLRKYLAREIACLDSRLTEAFQVYNPGYNPGAVELQT